MKRAYPVLVALLILCSCGGASSIPALEADAKALEGGALPTLREAAQLIETFCTLPPAADPVGKVRQAACVAQTRAQWAEIIKAACAVEPSTCTEAEKAGTTTAPASSSSSSSSTSSSPPPDAGAPASSSSSSSSRAGGSSSSSSSDGGTK